tara:strand:- start:2942 stop:3634 length:693 start_codon:yes stop_codon:yes gene_type:complete
MAGILKLDQLEEITSDQGIKLSHNLKDPTGNNILTVGSSNASLGSGIDISTPLSTATFPAGNILQVVELHDDNYKTINSASIKCYDIQITTKQANSKIYVMINVGRSCRNHDTDVALAMGYKTGAISSSSADYTSLHSSKYTRQIESNLGSFWSQDTHDPGGGTWSGQYAIIPVIFTKLHSPNVAKNTLLSYSLWGSSENGTFYIGTSYYTGSGTNGYDNSITLMEISNG